MEIRDTPPLKAHGLKFVGAHDRILSKPEIQEYIRQSREDRQQRHSKLVDDQTEDDRLHVDRHIG